MASVHFSYLLDLEKYIASIGPLLPDLAAGEFEGLRTLALTKAQNDKAVRTLLDSVFISHVYEHYTDPEPDNPPPAPQYCLVATFKDFVESLPKGSQLGSNGWQGYDLLRIDLHELGWGKQDTDTFLFGDSFCNELRRWHIEPLSAPSSHITQGESFWCNTVFGTINLQQATMLRERARLARAHIQNARHGLFSTEGRRIPGEHLLRAFDHIEAVLQECKERHQVLLVTVSS